MEKANTRDNQQSRLRTILAGDTFKALLPLIGFVVIIVVLNIMTQGKILTPKKLRLLFSQIYYPTIVAVGVFFVVKTNRAVKKAPPGEDETDSAKESIKKTV